jgi:putative ubiquitin-RnfH superfamily antitoxin RatB of RatAB toxin-antitoxin module
MHSVNVPNRFMSNSIRSELKIEIVLAIRERQWIQNHLVPSGTTVLNLVTESGILKAMPQMKLSDFSLAIHGRIVDPQQKLLDGDRIEVLRPLTVDPKQARHRRAKLKSSKD